MCTQEERNSIIEEITAAFEGVPKPAPTMEAILQWGDFMTEEFLSEIAGMDWQDMLKRLERSVNEKTRFDWAIICYNHWAIMTIPAAVYYTPALLIHALNPAAIDMAGSMSDFLVTDTVVNQKFTDGAPLWPCRVDTYTQRQKRAYALAVFCMNDSDPDFFDCCEGMRDFYLKML